MRRSIECQNNPPCQLGTVCTHHDRIVSGPEAARLYGERIRELRGTKPIHNCLVLPCRCPVDGNWLWYAPALEQHACTDRYCIHAHGMVICSWYVCGEWASFEYTVKGSLLALGDAVPPLRPNQILRACGPHQQVLDRIIGA